MKKLFFIVFFIAIGLLSSNNLFAKKQEVTYAPQDTNMIDHLLFGFSIPNNDGGITIIGTLSRKQIILYEDYPPGVYALKLVPDKDSIYKIDYYAEYAYEKPLYIGRNNSDAYYKDNGNLVIINNHNYYYGGHLGFSMYKLPLLIEFDPKGKFLSSYVDTTTKRVQLYGQFNPIFINADKSFFQICNPIDTAFHRIVASNFDSSGRFISTKYMKEKPFGDYKIYPHTSYTPLKIISDKGKGFFLHSEFNIYYTSYFYKKTASIMKLDSNKDIIKEINIADYTGDDTVNNYYKDTYISNMFVNKQDELIINGYYFFHGYRDFIYVYDKNSLELIRKKEWWSDNRTTLSLQDSKGKYLSVGSYDPFNNKVRSYAALALDSNFNEEYIINEKSTYPYNRGFYAVKEVSEGDYDFWGTSGDNLLLVRASESDFISGISEPQKNDDASFYYSSGFLNIRAVASGLANIGIYDVLGSCHFSASKHVSASSLEQIPISKLSRGVYIITMTYENGTRAVGRIICEE